MFLNEENKYFKTLFRREKREKQWPLYKASLVSKSEEELIHTNTYFIHHIYSSAKLSQIPDGLSLDLQFRIR